MCFWLGWVFLAVCGLSLGAVSGGLVSSCAAQASPCGGFSFLEPGLWGTRASLVTACGLSSAWGYLPYSIWNLPGARIEPVFPAVAGGLLITGLPGNSCPFLPPEKASHIYY